MRGAILLALCLCWIDLPAVSQASPTSHAMQRIALSSQQGMLVQRMLKAACFAGIGVAPKRHLAMLAADMERFAAGLHSLTSGDAKRGLEAETDLEVLSSLNRTRLVWLGMAEPVASIIGAQIAGEGDVLAMAGQAPALMAKIRAARRSVHRAHAPNRVAVGEAIARDLAERQRMLAQKMVAELCLIARGYEVDETRAALRGSIAFFVQTLEALMFGAADVGVPPPRAPERIQAIERIAAVWAPLAPLLGQVAAGDPPGFFTLLTVAEKNDHLLAELDQLLRLMRDGASRN